MTTTNGKTELPEPTPEYDPALAENLAEQAAAALRLGPSDDYELLLAVDPAGREACERAARETATPLAFVGRFSERRGGMSLVAADGTKRPLDPRGFDHFTGRS